jgi:hypothetical protein
MATIVNAPWGMQAWIVVSPTVSLPVDMGIVPMDDVNVILVGKGTTVAPLSVDLDTINLDTFAWAAFDLVVTLHSNLRNTLTAVN